MIRDQFILDLGHELAVDNFAGGGGASTGIERAIGRHPDLAINHNAEALGMHEVNHPQTLHLREDVFAVDPLKVTQGRPVAIAWFSPDCKHFSKAKGGKPVDKKIRGLALVILNWAATVRPRVIIKENVEEIQTWGPLLPNGRPDPAHKGRTYRAFVDALSTGIRPDHPDLPEILEVCAGHVTKEQLVRGLGYKVEGRELRACDYGAPTIRKRFFMVARCDGVPIVWPEPTHCAPENARLLKLKPWRTAAECIDWSIPCPSIFLPREEARKVRCKRPLVRASLARIAKGVGRYVINAKEPFLVSVTHQGGDRLERVGEPFRTITGAHRGEKALVSPYMVPRYGERSGQNPRSMPVTKPMPVVVPTANGGSLVAPVLVGAGGPAYQGKPRPVDKVFHTPVPTVVAGGQHHALAAVYLAQHNGGEKGHQSVGHEVIDPTSTISGKGSQQNVVAATVVEYYGNTKGVDVGGPGHTVVTKERFGLVEAECAAYGLTPEQLEGARRVAEFLRAFGVEFEGELATVKVGDAVFVIVDIGLRMLTPRELFRAQGFPDTYVIDRAIIIDADGNRREVMLTKEAQIRMCGNSVCPPMAEALVRANLPELSLQIAA